MTGLVRLLLDRNELQRCDEKPSVILHDESLTSTHYTQEGQKID